MEHNLLVCKLVVREMFDHESYIGTDDILALVESGSFIFDDGSGMQRVEALEAVNFKKGKHYSRHITEKATIYLFRYRAEGIIFDGGKVTFRDKERIRSTLELLHLSDHCAHLDDFDCKRALFADIVNQFRLENAGQPTGAGHPDQLIEDAVAEIKGSLHKKVNLAELAGNYYLSYVQFSRRFKAATGTTPQEYIAGLRLNKAKTLLSDTDLPIKQVAQSCGFGSEYYFSNFFRKYCRMPPTQYRMMIRTTENA